MKFTRVEYSELKKTKQKEIYNFQKISAILADYGFATIKLDNDWQGADFIAQHFDDGTFFKVQLKGRLTFAKIYIGKNIYICFPHPSDPDKGQRDWYIFDHDELLYRSFLERIKETDSWKIEGVYSYPDLSKDILALLSDYKL